MNRFVSTIKMLDEKIDLPQPMKSRILLEISADLNDLFEYYKQKGLSDHEAEQKTQEKFHFDEKSIEELTEVYNTGFYRWLHTITDRTRNRWEKLALVFIILFSLFFVGQVILSSEFFLHSSVFVIPVLTIVFFALILLMIKFYKIYILKDHNIKRLRSNLPSILFLGGATLLVGVLGFFIHLYLTVSMISSDIEKTLSHLIEMMISSSAYLMICLILTIFISILLYILYTKITKIEIAASEYLLNQ